MSSAAKITVRLFRVVAGQSNVSVGAGWLCAQDLIVTCAHVVNAALGRQLTEPSLPQDADVVLVRSPVTGDGGAVVESFWRVSAWDAPRNSALGGFDGDVAFLTPVAEGFGRPDPRLALASPSGAEFSAFGFPADFDVGRSGSGVIGDPAGARFELKVGRQDDLPTLGFSGAPVMVGSEVAGIVGSIASGAQIAYLIPVAAFPPGHLHIRILPPVHAKFPHIRDLLFHLEKLDQRARASRTLDLRGVFCDDYAGIENLLRKPPPDVYPDDRLKPAGFLAQAVLQDTGTLLSAPGGSGKTHFLIDIAHAAMAADFGVFWLDLSRLAEAGSAPKKAELFDNTTLAGGHAAFEKARINNKKLLLIADGLNERSSLRDDVATILADMRRLESIPIILGDRLSHRTSRDSFKSATLSPLSLEEIRDRVGPSLESEENWKRLLSSPFFLSLYLKVRGTDRTNAPKRKDMFDLYFSRHVFQGVPEWRIEALTEPAFRFYRNEQRRAAPRANWLKNGFSGPDIERLQDARALTNSILPEGDIEFAHQLLHDWCAARHIASLPQEEWTNDKFKWLTLRHGSADAVGLAAELVPAEQLTNFLICAYDWSWVAVLEVILDFEQRQHGGASPVPVELRDAIFALNALREFDLFEHTREAARGPLKYYSELPNALKVSGLASAEQVIAAYRGRYGAVAQKEPLAEFGDMFLNGVAGTGRAVRLVVKGPLLGWTAANMIRQRSMDTHYVSLAIYVFEILRAAAVKAQEAVGVRWRIAHTLGRAGEHEKVEKFLFRTLFDHEESDMVRFGAGRSLMEIAALTKDTNQRHRILTLLTRYIGRIQSITARSELCRATVIAEDAATPPGWYEAMDRLLAAGLAEAKKQKAPDVATWEKRRERIAEKKAALK